MTEAQDGIPAGGTNRTQEGAGRDPWPALQDLSLIDSHVHLVHPERMDEVLALMEAIPCRRFHLVCLPHPDTRTDNPAALRMKQAHPRRAYISGALDYSVLADPGRAPALLAAQVAGLKAQGFDGLKLIEGKPEVRRLLPHRLDGPLYEPLWEALEEQVFPVVFHVNDPDEFWDAERCPTWARQAGWDYHDGRVPSKEDLYAEVDHILVRHPGLRITFAHFYFLSRELGRAARFLEAHPGVCFDLAPHLDMYRDFSQDPAAAREFFLSYSDRLLFGTDTDTRTLARGPDGRKLVQFIPRLIRSILEQGKAFTMEDGAPYHGLGLDRESLEKIYARNFERIYGPLPAALPPGAARPGIPAGPRRRSREAA